MTKWRSVIVLAAIVAAVAGGGWGASQLLRRIKPSAPPSGAPITGAPTAAEVSPETNKVVLDEMQTSSGEVFKAVSGKVLSVSGTTLVLEAEGDRLQISVTPATKITRQVAEITLDQIKVGQKVDALIRIEGEQVVATNLNLIVGP